MRIVPKFTKSSLLTTRLAPVFCALSLTSFAPAPTIDPSLLAAEPYNPTYWNGTTDSNQALEAIYKNYSRELNILAHAIYPNFDAGFARAGHRSIEIPYRMAFILKDMRTKYNGSTIDFITAISMQYKLPYQNTLFLYNELEHITQNLKLQQHANCYAYSVNDFKNDFYGVAVGTKGLSTQAHSPLFQNLKPEQLHDYTQYTINGAIKDGLIYTGSNWPTKAGYYRIALFISKGTRDGTSPNDYHWARQNRDGTWSHKFGDQNVTNIDFAGKPITDISKVDFGSYKFAGFFLAPHGGIDVGPKAIPTKESPTPKSL